MSGRTSFLAATAVLALLAFSAAAADLRPDGASPVNFQARQLFHDDESSTVTATGDVELVQGQRILRAEKMVYHLDTDTVQAMGNVSLLDEDGSVHFAEYVELKRDMKDGFVQGLLSMLADGARFTAVESERRDGVKTVMREASYTPCRVCETDPKPTWQIKADTVTHDAEKENIRYKNARLEVGGVPVLWTPVFSHADPSVKQRSGFLRPRYGWTDNVGTFVEGGYYMGIAPDRDATLRLRPTTQKGILAQGEWRQRFENGRLQVNAGGVQSDREEADGRIEQDRTRGHIFASGQFDLDPKWRAGFDVARVSDKNYLRLYDIDKRNTLINDVYAERFSGRDYSRVAAVNVQDLRLGQRPVQPEVLPMAEHRMLGEPQSLLGGRWEAGMSAAGLHRPGAGQDTQRASARLGWRRNEVHGTGIEAVYDASLNGDAYAVHNSIAAAGGNASAGRGNAYAAATGSYPLVKRLDGAQALIAPVAGVSFASDVDNDPLDIPDEDSIDVQIDANSLFSENRFPGADRREDGARVNYGMKTGIYGDGGAYGKVFVGQSYRFADNEGLFPEGSGLENRSSDIVGQVSAGISDGLNADYRIQLDRETLSARRHEVQATGRAGRLRLDTRFIYLDAVAGTGFIEPREQLQVGGAYGIDENWSLSSAVLSDFGAEPGLRKASLALSYADECFSLSAEGRRNLISEASGESGTVVMLRVGLKNIGEFSSPEILLHEEPEEGPEQE